MDHLARVFGTILFAFVVLPSVSPLTAQTLRGRVISEQTLAPVEGAFVTLLDGENDRIDAALSDAQGFYRLDAGVAGTYRARVDRIGFEPWVSETFELADGEDRTEDLSISIRPVRLTNLDVRVRTRCMTEVDAEEDAAVWLVWEEARKALETAVFADEEEMLRFNTLVTERLLDDDDLELLGADSMLLRDVVRSPFKSLAPELLTRHGYIQQPADTVFFYAPDASVLLSESFFDDHCFGLDTSLPDLVGLTFQPVEERELSDIAGAMWLDAETAELQHLDFRFVNVPYRIPTDRLGGWVDFVRLPGGPFVVENWWVRTPVFQSRNFRLSIAGYMESGGRIVDVFTRWGDPIDWR